jgi:hypothetical protein
MVKDFTYPYKFSMKYLFVVVRSFEVIQVEVVWVVMLCSVVVGCQHFRGPCCLHIQGETLVSYNSAIWHHDPEELDFNPH